MSNDTYSASLEKQLTEIVEASTDTDEGAQVGRGILHVQILNGPLSLQIKEAIGQFAKVLVKNAYKAGYKAGYAAALQSAPTQARKPHKGVDGLFSRH